jgi:hypothetical protein
MPVRVDCGNLLAAMALAEQCCRMPSADSVILPPDIHLLESSLSAINAAEGHDVRFACAQPASGEKRTMLRI